jgi:hypothetical protein
MVLKLGSTRRPAVEDLESPVEVVLSWKSKPAGLLPVLVSGRVWPWYMRVEVAVSSMRRGRSEEGQRGRSEEGQRG